VPLNKALETLLAQVKDESEREAMRKGFEKYEFFQTRFEEGLRQEDYDKNFNKIKEERIAEAAMIEGYKKKQKEYDDWAARNIPKHEELLKNFGELETKYKALEEEKAALVSAAAAGGGGGEKVVNEAELLSRVNAEITKKGYVSASDLPKIVEEQAKKMVTAEATTLRDNFYKVDLPGAITFMTAMNDIQFNYRNEFKESFDSKAFAKFMVDEKIEDPTKAYDRFVADKRAVVEREKIKAETKLEVEKEFASKYNLPGSGAPPAPELGPLQMRKLGKTPDLPAETEIGDNRAAYAAAAELRADGKF
jgi:hypothetical protein